jgi:hypothetical protein
MLVVIQQPWALPVQFFRGEVVRGRPHRASSHGSRGYLDLLGDVIALRHSGLLGLAHWRRLVRGKRT